MQRTGKQFKNIRGRLYKCVECREASLKNQFETCVLNIFKQKFVSNKNAKRDERSGPGSNSRIFAAGCTSVRWAPGSYSKKVSLRLVFGIVVLKKKIMFSKLKEGKLPKIDLCIISTWIEKSLISARWASSSSHTPRKTQHMSEILCELPRNHPTSSSETAKCKSRCSCCARKNAMPCLATTTFAQMLWS